MHFFPKMILKKTRDLNNENELGTVFKKNNWADEMDKIKTKSWWYFCLIWVYSISHWRFSLVIFFLSVLAVSSWWIAGGYSWYIKLAFRIFFQVWTPKQMVVLKNYCFNPRPTKLKVQGGTIFWILDKRIERLSSETWILHWLEFHLILA